MAKKKSLIGFDPLAWMKNPPAPPGETAKAPPPEKDGPALGPSPHAAEQEVRLGESLTIAQIRGIYEELKRVLQTAGAGATLRLDATAVESVDTAGTQLLVAFVRAAQAQGMVVRWRQGVAPALSECARRLGLHEALGLA